jgi:LmbE family N-acetylglucosaminyl deacetylase
MSFKTVLVLAAHTDDGELGCGGAIARFIEEGKDVYYVAFSSCEESIPQEFPKDILRTECVRAVKKLGIKPENLIVLNYNVRYFERDRQEILEEMVNLNKKIKPDLVFLPVNNDLHQDHLVISAEGLRAFKKVKVLGYEQVWNNLKFLPTFVIFLEKKHIDKKIAAIKEYKSQYFRSNYINEEFIRALATVRGVPVNAKYAESFEVYRWVI